MADLLQKKLKRKISNQICFCEQSCFGSRHMDLCKPNSNEWDSCGNVCNKSTAIEFTLRVLSHIAFQLFCHGPAGSGRWLYGSVGLIRHLTLEDDVRSASLFYGSSASCLLTEGHALSWLLLLVLLILIDPEPDLFLDVTSALYLGLFAWYRLFYSRLHS